jgi:predicted nucleic acid-binding Zn ribbon protein
MRDVPELDFTCSQCGNHDTYQLVPAQRRSEAPQRDVPTFDYTCSMCGARETYQLVPVGQHAHT